MGGLELYIAIISGSISIAVAVYKSIRYLSNKTFISDFSNALNIEGNIYLINKNGEKKQVTFLNFDTTPVLGKNRVLFFREIKYSRDTSYFNLIEIDLKNFKEKILIDQKPFRDGLTGVYEIVNPRNLVLSKDEKYLFFIIEKYVTASQLVQLDIKKQEWKDFISAESFEFINKGIFKGHLLIAVSEIGNRGRDIFYKIVDSNGFVKYKFNDYDQYMQFRSSYSLKSFQ